jgi:hypothetical protein
VSGDIRGTQGLVLRIKDQGLAEHLVHGAKLLSQQGLAVITGI